MSFDAKTEMLNTKKLQLTLNIIDSGVIYQEYGHEHIEFYFIMKKTHGQNLNQIMEQNGGSLSPTMVLEIGVQLISIFEKFHELGYLYNDLNLGHIISNKNGQNLQIVSFSKITPYMKENRHISRKYMIKMAITSDFASENQIKREISSRRDDMIQIKNFINKFVPNGD